jgi:hypothetical protein
MVAPAHAIRFWALEARRFRPTERMKGNAEVITGATSDYTQLSFPSIFADTIAVFQTPPSPPRTPRGALVLKKFYAGDAEQLKMELRDRAAALLYVG